MLGAGMLSVASPAAAAPPTDPTALVNPFVGTQNFGNTFPGASAPFGMVQVSPDTGGQGGYDYLQRPSPATTGWGCSGTGSTRS
jgi:putative alpha-1,2-mannosidase